MSVSVRATPSTLATPSGNTRDNSSWSLTRMITTRSYSPATEYTSETPGMSAMAWAASGISSISHCTSTTALTIVRSLQFARVSGPLEHHGHAHATADAQRAECEGQV